MHKKRNQNFYLTYDVHIVDALKALPVPLITFDGHEVYFDEDKRNETIYEHIANKCHHLHVVDIKEVPIILKDPKNLKADRYGDGFRKYVGRRGKKKETIEYLQIITYLKENNRESIITIFPTNINVW